MTQALEIFFDPDSEAAVRQLWARLEAAGLPSLAMRTHRRHRPHVSLAVAQRIDTTRLEKAHQCLAATHLDITLYSPAVFPRNGVLYLSVVPTRALLRLHKEVHAALEGSLVESWRTYSVDAWVPHCTLAQDFDPTQLARGVELLHDSPIIEAHVETAGVFDTTTGEIVPVATLLPHP
jgi:2'-5' RNA ligase